MSRESGFLQLRRGLWPHVRDGRMSVTETLAFIYICSEADTRTGIWKGCGKALSGELGIPERTARDVLERMERGGYIRRFTLPGSHTCYPILVHKFLITTGEHDSEQLNAIDSKSPTALAYFPGEHNGEQNGEHGAAQKRIENREKKKGKKSPAANPAPPADPRHKPFFDFAYRSFIEKYGQKPCWGSSDGKVLHTLLARSGITLQELQRRWGHYLESTEAFTQKQGGSLTFFCSRIDSFIRGPLHERIAGVRNGRRLVGEELTRANLIAAGYRPIN